MNAHASHAIAPPRPRRRDDVTSCLEGRSLYGDDLAPGEIARWTEDEKEAYASLGAGDRTAYDYAYHALNWRHGFRHLPRATFESVLGFGGGYGHELRPIVRRARRITIVEPSDALAAGDLDGTPVEHVKPTAEGTLPFDDDSFDLITCFGVLHHIANVSHVVRELCRCLRPGGHLLVREPTVSMGDWRVPRRGLTKRERGIPLAIFRRIIHAAGLHVIRETRWMCPLTRLLQGRVVRGSAWNSSAAVLLDGVLCRLLSWNKRYHAVHWLHKLRACTVFFVLTHGARRGA